MAVIDDYFRELEKRIHNAKSKEEEEVLVKEVRKLYFPPENRKRELKYKGELQRYYINKGSFLNDLKDIGFSYHALAESIGLKNNHIRKFKGEYCVTLLDKDRKNIMEFSGLDIMNYTKRTETAGRQPLRPIESGLIRESLEDEGLRAYKVSEDLLSNGSLIPNYLREGRMPLHIAMELCDMLGLDHDDIIVKED